MYAVDGGKNSQVHLEGQFQYEPKSQNMSLNLEALL